MENTELGRGAAHLTVAKILTLLISLATGMMLSRFRTVSEYGTYSQLLIAVSLASSVFMLGLPNSANYFLARAETVDERRDFLSVYYTLNTLLCVLIGCVLLLALPWIEAYFQNEAIRSFGYFLAVFPWTRITISGVSHVLVVYGKTKKLMAVNVVTSLVTLLSVLVVRLFGLSFRDFLSALLLGQALLSVWVYVLVNRLDGRLRPCLDGAMLRRILAYSIPIGLASLVGTVDVEIDKLMIGRLMDTEALAYYSNAGRELPLTVVATSLTAVLLPQTARLLKQGRTGAAVRLWGDSVHLSYLILCFGVTACVVFAPQIVTLLYSGKYLPGVQVFRVYALVLLLRATYFGLLLNSLGKTKTILCCSLAAMLVNVGLNYALFRLLGFVGPAAATFLSVLLTDLFQLLYTSKLVGVPLGRLFPWGALARVTLLNLAWGVAAWAGVRALGLGTGRKDILCCVAAGAVIATLYYGAVRRSARTLWDRLNGTEPETADEQRNGIGEKQE